MVLLALALAPLVACGPADEPAPKPRKWSVVAEDFSGGALMAGALLADATPLLVGGDSKRGGAWRLTDDGLQEEAIPLGKMLSWNALAPDGRMLAVGHGRRALWRSASGAWTTEALPAGDLLWGCVALGGDQAWAVGANQPSADQNVPVLLRRGAGGWSEVALPALPKGRENVQLFKVAAHHADDVLVVGDQGVVLHWDGTSWQVEDAGTTDNIVTVRQLAGGRYIIVGGLANGFVRVRAAHGSWSEVAKTMVGLSGVDVYEGHAMVSGWYGWIERVALDTGASQEFDDPLTIHPLHFVLHLPGGDALSGGGNYMQAGAAPMVGSLLRWAP